MEYSKPSDVAFGSIRQMAADLAEMTDALETELQDYAQLFGDLSLALRNSRAIIHKHLGPLEMDGAETLLRFQLMLANDSAKASLKLKRDIDRLISRLPGRGRRRRRER